ncbi:SEC14-like protein 2 [Ruditapes philippinarum]|uniref:SEC14-like protein 2 n=1 Tax=Ruditapes philippinarum TaxID=129788 RepID=UPI00295B2C24|nr:SEC14-like protein 2 [Ruditapes philippinarum]
MTIIYDLKNLGARHLNKESVDMYLSIVDAAESRYPEVLRRVFVINSPKIFPIIWSLVRPFLHENTAKKVVVLSGELPPFICQGGTVPKEYYNQAEPHHAMVTGNIGRGSTLQLEYEVHEPNSVIRYEFQTDGYDIGFGVFRKKSKERMKASEMDTILSTQRSNCHLVPEDGAVECDLPGIYVIRFDNTYSWARSKKVYYLIEVLEPESKSNTGSSNAGENDEGDDEFVLAQEETVS